MEQILRKIKEFHGHLGPYAAIGYRMGAAANRVMGEDALKKKAIVFCGTKTPLSCMIDGVQLSSGCTMGKGNIAVEELGEPRAVFSLKDGTNGIEVRLREEVDLMIKEKMTSWDSGEELAIQIFSMTDDELLSIRNL